MIDENKLAEKFSLEKESTKQINEIKILHPCKNHPEIESDYICPICKKLICEGCEKILSTDKKGQQKIICVDCWHQFILKTILFVIVLIITSFLIYFLNNQT